MATTDHPDGYVHGKCFTPPADRRTNIVIDDTLVAEAMKITGASTKKKAVEPGLKAEATGAGPRPLEQAQLAP
ncbi:MAG: type II toxin-antitoxin system VapB family antitoxin [Gammaproteobacteria bacterium]|nr:type II toxin-antitoxin system VapB family antitoxin [Gammaproteobacteria bacterium]